MRALLTAAILTVTLAACTQSITNSTNQPPQTATLRLPETSDTRFEHDVLDSDQPVLVDFYANWCEGCRRMQPVLSQIKHEYGNKIKLIRVDVDKNPDIVERYRITAIPHLMIFRNGDLTEDILGTTTAARLSHALDNTLASGSGKTL